jgi:uncharacterized protein YbjT (DUF2867 family)
LAAALAGANVVVDVSNAPSWEDNAVLEFFETSSRNIHAAEKAVGVAHHVALSVVGTERLLASGYFRAKLAQENLIKASGIPYTIVRATQFFEFVGAIADSGSLPSDGEGSSEGSNTLRLSPAMMQPIAPDDVAAILADVVNSVSLPSDGKGSPNSTSVSLPSDGEGSPNSPSVSLPSDGEGLREGLVNTTIEIAGPEPIRMDDLVRQYLTAKRDPRKVTTDNSTGYFGTPVTDESLVPTSPNPRLGPTRFGDWLTRVAP